MSLYLDLDDVAAESPVATKELAELRARVRELEEAGERAVTLLRKGGYIMRAVASLERVLCGEEE